MNAARWLYLAALVTAITGALIALGALPPRTFDPLLAVLFGEPAVAGPPGRLGLGIAGAIMAGWGVMLAILARSIGSLSPSVLGAAVAAGTLTWFLLDGIVSIVTGAALNLVGNTVFLVLLVAPALALRRRRG